MVVNESLLGHVLQTEMFAERWRTHRFAPTYDWAGVKPAPTFKFLDTGNRKNT